MSRRILFFGNCQARYLYRLFAENICPLTGDTVSYLGTGTTDFTTPEHAAAVREADILVDQVFDVPDEVPLELLAGVKQRLRIPNIRGDFIWPFNTRELHPNDEHFSPFTKGYYAHENGDSFLNRMIVQRVAPREAVDRYLDVDFRKTRNVQRIYEICLDRQRRRDKIAGLRIADVIDANVRTRVLFSTPGHPFEDLLFEIAQPVLGALLPSELVERALRGQDQSHVWKMSPIHPGVARALSLRYISDHTQYAVYHEGCFTFEEYALRYMRGDSIPELAEALKTHERVHLGHTTKLVEQGLAKGPTSALAHRFRSRLLRQKKQLDQALVSALKAVTLEFEDFQNIVELVECHLACGDLAAAEGIARLAVSKFPRQSAVYHSICDVMVRLRNETEFERFAEAAVELHPGGVNGLLRVARQYLAFDRLGRAEQLLAQARTSAPRDSGVAALDAEILHRRGQRSGSIAAMRTAISIAWGNPQLYGRLAHLLLLDGDLDGAEAAWRKAVSLNPTAAAFQCGLADVLDRKGRRPEAVGLLAETISRGHADAHVHACLARLQLREGDLAGAEGQFRQAISLDPTVADFHGGLADILDRQGRTDEAIVQLSRLTEHRSGDPHAHGRLAHLLMRSGQLEQAEAAFRRAIALDAASGSFDGGLVDVLDRQGRRAEAIDAARIALSRLGHHRHLAAKLGYLLMRDGDLLGAEQVYRRALESDPGSVGLQTGLADVLERQGRSLEALPILRDAVTKERSDPHILGRLAHLLSRLGDLPCAETAYRQAVALDPSTTGFHGGLIDVLERQGRRTEAIALANDILSRVPNEPHTTAKLGHLLTLDGDLKRAEDLYRSAAAVHPGVSFLQSGLADVLERQNRSAEALSAAHAAMATAGSDPHDYGRAASLLSRLRDLAGAEQAYRRALALDSSLFGFHAALADVLARQDRGSEAAAAARVAFATGGSDAHVFARIAHIFMLQNDLSAAEAAYSKAIALDPTVAGFHNGLAETLTRQGRGAEAHAVLRKASAEGCADQHTMQKLAQMAPAATNVA